MIRSTLYVAILALMFSGCSKKHPLDKVTHVEATDTQMNAAMAKANASLNQFITHLKSPKPGETGFAIKTGISEGTEKEYFWLSRVTYDGKEFQGIIDNDPALVKNVKFGQKITVRPADVSDWMYLNNRKLVGGLTLLVLRDKMSPAERAEFDKNVPFKLN